MHYKTESNTTLAENKKEKVHTSREDCRHKAPYTTVYVVFVVSLISFTWNIGNVYTAGVERNRMTTILNSTSTVNQSTSCCPDIDANKTYHKNMSKKGQRKYSKSSPHKANESLVSCDMGRLSGFPDIQLHEMPGGILIYLVISTYSLIGITDICLNYFVPALETLCEALALQSDVSGATLMALGCSAPEMFTHFIALFVANNDYGVSTVIGSAIFNLLFVIACCGLFGGITTQLHWYPLSRDTLFYCVAILELALISDDGMITWYEGLTMCLTYVPYIFLMTYNQSLQHLVTWRRRRPLSSDTHQDTGSYTEEQRNKIAMIDLRSKRHLSRHRGTTVDYNVLNNLRTTQDELSHFGLDKQEAVGYLYYASRIKPKASSKSSAVDPLPYFLDAQEKEEMRQLGHLYHSALCSYSASTVSPGGTTVHTNSSDTPGSKTATESTTASTSDKSSGHRTGVMRQLGHLYHSALCSYSASTASTGGTTVHTNSSDTPGKGSKSTTRRFWTTTTTTTESTTASTSDKSSGHRLGKKKGQLERCQQEVSLSEVQSSDSRSSWSHKYLTGITDDSPTTSNCLLKAETLDDPPKTSNCPQGEPPSTDFFVENEEPVARESCLRVLFGSVRTIEELSNMKTFDTEAWVQDTVVKTQEGLSTEEEPVKWYGRWYCKVLVIPFHYLHKYSIPPSRHGPWQTQGALLAFLISVIYLFGYCFIMAWMLSAAGAYLHISEEVLSVTVISVVTSAPNLVSSVIMAMNGYGDMAVSNQIGSNAFDILLGLGLPWFTSGLMVGDTRFLLFAGDFLKSNVAVALILAMTVSYLWISLRLMKWRITWLYGLGTGSVYFVVMAFVTWFEWKFLKCAN